MAEKINRRELIIQTAADLFIQKGYAATTMRQIAEAVGCTEAALYYHFKEGKRALLQAVIESKTPTFLTVLENCHKATSLSNLIIEYGHSMMQYSREHQRHIQWLVSEYPNLSSEEQALFDNKHLNFHAQLTQEILRFEPHKTEAEEIAWMLICASVGYQQIFTSLGLSQHVDFTCDKFTRHLAHCITQSRTKVAA